MLNSVFTPSTEKLYLRAEEHFLIDEPLCGGVRPCKAQDLQLNLVYKGVPVLVGRQYRADFWSCCFAGDAYGEAWQRFPISRINTNRCQNCKVSILINIESILSELIPINI